MQGGTGEGYGGERRQGVRARDGGDGEISEGRGEEEQGKREKTRVVSHEK